MRLWISCTLTVGDSELGLSTATEQAGGVSGRDASLAVHYVTVQSVEMRDVVIPTSLQDAMSREAQASREKSARIILGQAEVEIAHLFFEAAKSYENNPTALHLRAMNILYEGLKEKGALMLVPSTAVESMGLGGLMGAAALRQQTLSEGNTRPAPATV
jgi:regulator of protease activity HflC (stomatin/prohibitin superfamily)